MDRAAVLAGARLFSGLTPDVLAELTAALTTANLKEIPETACSGSVDHPGRTECGESDCGADGEPS
jgi:uncharacterized low-complexity protein